MIVFKHHSKNFVLSVRDYLNNKNIRCNIEEQDGQFCVSILDDSDEFRALQEINKIKNDPNATENIIRAAWQEQSSDSGDALPHINMSRGLKYLVSVTGVISCVCIVVCILQMLFDHGISRPIFDDLSLDAAKISAGELWRLVTPIFLHFGIFHIAFNVVIFSILGYQVERWLGVRRLIIIVLISAITGNVAEYTVLANANEAFPGNFGGISGPVNALIGYLAVISRCSKRPARMQNYPGFFMITLVMIVVAEIFMSNIANAAHIAGLISGVLIGGIDLFMLNKGILKFKAS